MIRGRASGKPTGLLTVVRLLIARFCAAISNCRGRIRSSGLSVRVLEWTAKDLVSTLRNSTYFDSSQFVPTAIRVANLGYPVIVGTQDSAFWNRPRFRTAGRHSQKQLGELPVEPTLQDSDDRYGSPSVTGRPRRSCVSIDERTATCPADQRLWQRQPTPSRESNSQAPFGSELRESARGRTVRERVAYGEGCGKWSKGLREDLAASSFELTPYEVVQIERLLS